MKTLILLLFLLMTAILAAVVAYKPPETTEVTVLRDITETHLSQPKAEEIASLYDLEKEIWNGGIFRFSEISDVSYNRTYESNIASQNKWLGNEFERKERVKKFYEEIKTILDEMERENTGRKYSSVYIPMARELNRLSQSKSQKKILLVYSDLMENGKELSYYDPRTLNLLRTNPDAIIKHLEEKTPLPSLEGLEIYFVFQPQYAEADREFRIVSMFYKELFQDKGAKAEITANLTL